MAEFKITNSKIEQVNDSGANYKIVNNSAPITVSGGDSVQTTGTGHTVRVSPSAQPSVVGKIWKWVQQGFTWVVGCFVKPG